MRRAAAAGLGCVALAAACDRAPPTSSEDLAKASDTIIFASMEALGPHRCTSVQTRSDTRPGQPAQVREESRSLQWASWDDWNLQIAVDGRTQSDVRVVAGIVEVADGRGAWRRRADPEPYRAQLRSTWDSWDSALEAFADRVVLTGQGQEQLDGRDTRVFGVRLGEADQRAPARQTIAPRALTGKVWLDEATAVRLRAEVDGELAQGTLVRSVGLRLRCAVETGQTP